MFVIAIFRRLIWSYVFIFISVHVDISFIIIVIKVIVVRIERNLKNYCLNETTDRVTILVASHTWVMLRAVYELVS